MNEADRVSSTGSGPGPAVEPLLDDEVEVNLIERWATAALAEAEVEQLDDPERFYFASIPNAPGAWSYEPSVDKALAALHEVLVGWATLKLADGDADIPEYAGIRLGGMSRRLIPSVGPSWVLDLLPFPAGGPAGCLSVRPGPDPEE